MPRPRKWRRVGYIPNVKVFGPLNKDNTDNEIIMLNVEELESIRLMDLEGLDQVTCAEKMGIARSTFQRIYSETKKKIADSLVNGKVIKIEGGNYTLNICNIQCENCGYSWKESYENITSDNIKCPKCGAEVELICCECNDNEFCGRCGRGRNRGMGRGLGNRRGRVMKK